MRTCPSCGRFITDASASVCPTCGASLTATDAAPQPTTNQPVGAPLYAPPSSYAPYAPYAPSAPNAPQEPMPYGPPAGQPPYGPGYGAPAPYSQPYQPAPPAPSYAPPSQPMAPPYGQPTYGSAYGAPPAPPSAPLTGQPTYGSGYGAQGGYPGAYRPGVDWKPSQGPAPRPWGRIIGGIVAALAVIAIVAGVIYNFSHVPAHSSDTTASAKATALNSGTLLSDSMLTVDTGWPQDSHCYFDTDGYHIHDAFICYAPIGNQVDGTESVTAKQITGPTNYAYGLVFRRVSKGNYYFFGIDSGGNWVVDKVVNDTSIHLQDFTVNIAIKGGLNTANSISVTMTGNTFDFYVNGQKVGTIHDSTFPEGEWGLAGDTGINVVFTDYLAHT